jgi:tetratricopeptide (TPR) repeat protein
MATDRVAPVDGAVLEQPAMRRALAERDISTVYRLLTESGLPQWRIAQLTGQQQSDVSEVLHGRAVVHYSVLERIAEGLGVPRAWMGLAYHDAPLGDYASAALYPGMRAADEEEVEEMKRRALLAAAAATLVGRPMLGPVLAVADPAEQTPLPAELGRSDVTALAELGEHLRLVARAHGGMAEVLSPTVYRAERLLGVPGSDEVHRALRSTLAELHILAGWTSYDTHLHDAARAHYRRALDLAAEADDVPRMLSCLGHAAVLDREHGAPEHALRLYELAYARLSLMRPTSPAESRHRAVAETLIHVRQAAALAELDRADLAAAALARAGDNQVPLDRFDRADIDHLRATTYLRMAMLDQAEQRCSTALHAWGDTNRRDRVLTLTALATTYARDGQADPAARWAVRAIETTEALHSVRARDQLIPLGDALAQRDSTCQDLARRIWHLQELRRLGAGTSSSGL